MPDIVLVKKIFPKVRKYQKKRIWKLNQLDKQVLDENNIWKDKKGKKKDNAGMMQN